MTLQVQLMPSVNRKLAVFFVLQALDLLTTITIFRHGGAEANLLLVFLMYRVGVEQSIFIGKAIASALAFVGFYTGRHKFLLWMNWFFAFVVAWNLSCIFRLWLRGSL